MAALLGHIGMHPKGEFVIGELFMQEPTCGPHQGLSVLTCLGRQDHMHGVARLVGIQRLVPGLRGLSDRLLSRDRGAVGANRRSVMGKARELEYDTSFAVAGFANWLHRNGILHDPKRLGDPRGDHGPGRCRELAILLAPIGKVKPMLLLLGSVLAPHDAVSGHCRDDTRNARSVLQRVDTIGETVAGKTSLNRQ